MAATAGLPSPAGPAGRDVFAEGLLEFLRPAVGQLDTHVHAVRESQVELREHIDSLAAELCRINEDQKVALDLDPYVKKLLNARRRVVLVNNILQNAQERLRRLNHSVGKETARRRAFLDASSNYPHSSPTNCLWGVNPLEKHKSWKGENVATTEVGETLSTLESLREVMVYGVAVPGHDGRAGMATLVLQPDANFNGPQIYHHVTELLPPYAWPRFLRLQDRLEMTETFKQKRFRLVEEGFDPARISDPLFVLDVTARTYVPLTPDVWTKIAAGELRL